MKRYKEKKCADKDCDKTFRQYNSLQKYCSPACTSKNAKPKELKPYPKIKRVSDKRKVDEPIYTLKRILFLKQPENKHCVIHGTYCTGIATTVDHKMGRRGFADDWARNNNVSLLIDERFFQPACNNCNLELENNSELKRKHHLSRISGKPLNQS